MNHKVGKEAKVPGAMRRMCKDRSLSKSAKRVDGKRGWKSGTDIKLGDGGTRRETSDSRIIQARDKNSYKQAENGRFTSGWDNKNIEEQS